MTTLTGFLLARLAEERALPEWAARVGASVMADPGLPDHDLRVLASVYADHPDYDTAWRP